jgi:hypothetical protein
MKAFEPAYSQEALASLLEAGGARRRHALTVIARLGRFPVREGDCTINGLDGRHCQLLLLDGLLLTYWVDDAAREVRIVTIEWSG